MAVVEALFKLFMGNSPNWYKKTILIFLILNPFLLSVLGPYIAGWIVVLEFIFTLAMALKCYPLLPGGLICLEVLALGMTSPEAMYNESHHQFPVILLLMFMIAGIYFLKEFLAWIFTKIIFLTRSKIILSVLFCFMGAILSAWLDALTVTAVIISISMAFIRVYESVGYEERVSGDYSDNERRAIGRADLDEFQHFLRNLVMHGAVGTALGGVTTIVGEPQNLLIGHVMGWQFGEFFIKMMPVTMPVFLVGLITCTVVEKFKIFGYGAKMPERVREVLQKHEEAESARRQTIDYVRLSAQGLAALWLVVGLAFHLAEVGILGLSVIILATTFTGKNEEHQIGNAFEEALPFTALLVVFFGIVSMIESAHLFQPIIQWALSLSGHGQIYAFFSASGILSIVSDNVFVATIYIKEAEAAFNANIIDRAQFDLLAVAINTGTNIPSVATPNGQAAFLFLLTSALSGLIQLSYVRMVVAAIPYTITMTLSALGAIYLFLL